MNIKYKHLKEASEAYEAINQINKEIKEIESLIKLVANGNNVVAKMKITDQELFKKESARLGLDYDGSLMEAISRKLIVADHLDSTGFFGNPIKKTKAKSKAKYNVDISNGTAIRVLSILIEEKVKERNTFLAELQQLGFNII